MEFSYTHGSLERKLMAVFSWTNLRVLQIKYYRKHAYTVLRPNYAYE
jgi:hypothetical protein